MLEWFFENGKWLGFDDGTLMYRVLLDPEGWTWEDVPEWEGECEFESAEEAKLAAEADYAKKQAIWEAAEAAANEDGELDLDLILENYWDDVAHERMERAKGFID
jgi:hypothetical protein